MNKKRLIKSIIGTVVIYLFLTAFIVIAPQIVDMLWHYGVYLCVFVGCSIAAGLLFKGQINAFVWSAATAIFFVVICAISSGDWDFGAFIRAVWFVVVQLLIPFFTAKSVARSINEGNERPVGLETAVRDTNKKRALKSIIGTVGIYLVLIVSVIILGKFFDVLAHYIVYCVALIVCSIAAGLLFKGQIYAWMWLAATAIFVTVVWGLELEGLFTGVMLFLLPLLIPFLIAKSVFLSLKIEKELAAKNETPETETHPD